MDPLQTILTLMNTLGSFFNNQQQGQAQQQVYGQQENALAFMQDPQKMNQFMTALQSPYAFGTAATGPAGGQANQYFNQFQTPYGNVANPQVGAANQAYLQSQQTPYTQMLGQQNPNQMVSLENQYTQGLNSALTSGVWNATQGQLANAGLSQAPGVAQYAYSQALAPYYQQNLQLGAQQAAAPIQYGLSEQQYGLNAGQLPLSFFTGQQQYGLNAGQVPLSYGLQSAQLGLGEATNALQYPQYIGAGLAGQFPGYQLGAGGGIV